MTAHYRTEASEGSSRGDFARRHIGPSEAEQAIMLSAIGVASREALMDAVVPPSIRRAAPMDLPAPVSEAEVLGELAALAAQNSVAKSLIGQGYYGTHTPPVIQRNVLENPAWYTAYTPYQPEISQGRLEALLTFQTMVCDLTGLEIANASLLDEGTAAAEAMALARRQSKSKANAIFVSRLCHPQTIDVVAARAEPLGIEVIVGDHARDLDPHAVFGGLFQSPATDGAVIDYTQTIGALHGTGALAVVATDLLALTLLKTPGDMGADIAVGSAQRFGVPMGFGGPHAAFFATREDFKRVLPGRLVGVSIDAKGRPAYRLTLQTREQHIRREKATSNICTAQVLLANMAAFYATYHGPDGLRDIAEHVRGQACAFASALRGAELTVETGVVFDTVTVRTGERTGAILAAALEAGYNLRRLDDARLAVSFDETTDLDDVAAVLRAFRVDRAPQPAQPDVLPETIARRTPYLEHATFHRYRSETEMMRYLRALADKDLALDRAMIPLGSCTMKLNAAAEMAAISWPAFAALHPFAPLNQATGYLTLIERLEAWLAEITGYDAVSLQPNSGAQGEYAGLLAIRAYHRSRGDDQRTVCLIPASAHGTNPASANMAGMDVVVVGCDADGNVDVADLRTNLAAHGERLAALMVTYPSTHGVFEAAIREICEIVHAAGGQVYLDGANLNAQMGLAAPGHYGADVSHLNLHKTFCIPHGGGGPGVGPIGVRAHLAPFLPGHRALAAAPERHRRTGAPVAAAPFGSAGILAISYAYIRMMGAAGLQASSEVAILSANYVAKRLEAAYPVLYRGRDGLVAHECIIDPRPLKESADVTVDDIAKRLMDYGFHAPTMSWPVPGTLMIEPTESEALVELDRFCDAMLAIHAEAERVAQDEWPREDNPLHNAPHTAEALVEAPWPHPYDRATAVFPSDDVRARKYWPPVARVDNVYGDRHVVCTCPPLEAYGAAAE